MKQNQYMTLWDTRNGTEFFRGTVSELRVYVVKHGITHAELDAALVETVATGTGRLGRSCGVIGAL